MQLAQKQAFADRMSRIQTRGANTCGVIHVGNTSNAKTSRNNVPDNTNGMPTRAALMSKGLRSAVIQVLCLGSGLVLYLRYVGL